MPNNESAIALVPHKFVQQNLVEFVEASIPVNRADTVVVHVELRLDQLLVSPAGDEPVADRLGSGSFHGAQ